MTNIQGNIDAVLQRIAKACNKAQRQPQEVTLLAVTIFGFAQGLGYHGLQRL